MLQNNKKYLISHHYKTAKEQVHSCLQFDKKNELTESRNWNKTQDIHIKVYHGQTSQW